MDILALEEGSPHGGVAGSPHARLVWFGADGRPVVRHAPIARDGRVRFDELPHDASFELWANAGGGRAVRAGELRPGDAEVRVESKGAGRISGKVVVAARDRPPGADVVAQAYPGFRAGRTRPAADGSFVISDLPEGSYTLVAGFNWGDVSRPVKVQARTGASDVVLDLRR